MADEREIRQAYNAGMYDEEYRDVALPDDVGMFGLRAVYDLGRAESATALDELRRRVEELEAELHRYTVCYKCMCELMRPEYPAFCNTCPDPATHEEYEENPDDGE